jgi:hypothetical protein
MRSLLATDEVVIEATGNCMAERREGSDEDDPGAGGSA